MLALAAFCGARLLTTWVPPRQLRFHPADDRRQHPFGRRHHGNGGPHRPPGVPRRRVPRARAAHGGALRDGACLSGRYVRDGGLPRKLSARLRQRRAHHPAARRLPRRPAGLRAGAAAVRPDGGGLRLRGRGGLSVVDGDLRRRDAALPAGRAPLRRRVEAPRCKRGDGARRERAGLRGARLLWGAGAVFPLPRAGPPQGRDPLGARVDLGARGGCLRAFPADRRGPARAGGGPRPHRRHPRAQLLPRPCVHRRACLRGGVFPAAFPLRAAAVALPENARGLPAHGGAFGCLLLAFQMEPYRFHNFLLFTLCFFAGEFSTGEAAP